MSAFTEGSRDKLFVLPQLSAQLGGDAPPRVQDEQVILTAQMDDTTTAVQREAMQRPTGPLGTDQYMRNGYIPFSDVATRAGIWTKDPVDLMPRLMVEHRPFLARTIELSDYIVEPGWERPTPDHVIVRSALDTRLASDVQADLRQTVQENRTLSSGGGLPGML